MTIKIGLLALDRCVGLSVFGPADLFNTANMISAQSGRKVPQFETEIISLSSDMIRTSSGHRIEARPLRDQEGGFDVVMIPGIGAQSFDDLAGALATQRHVAPILARLSDEGVTIAAACTGTFLLAQSGLLDRKRATTTWWMADFFRSEFPAVDLQENELLVDEGPLITSAAGASSLDLSLHLIDRFAGPSLARLSARYLVVDGGRKSQHLYSVPWHSRSREPILEKADAWIRSLGETKASVADLADHLGVTERSLLRKFRKITGMPPQAYIRNVRLDLSKQQLEEPRLSIAQIGAEAGFSDENAFRKAFVLRTGITPSQYRKQTRKPAMSVG